MTIHKGYRWNTASAYLRPAQKSRPDRLSVKDSILVQKIIFDGNKAIGVELLNKNGKTEKIYSDEVILSGGAINSPQLLMLSGN
jgi:choline dehydrogenase